MSKQLELGNLSAAEMDQRAAGLVTPYGMGTRSYSRSAEKREINAQRAEVTARYERGELAIGDCVIGPICTCRSFRLPHEIKRHRELRGEWDWRTEAQRAGIQRYQEPIK